MTVSFGDACHNHLIFFQSMKLQYPSRLGKKCIFALMCVCLNVSPPHRRGDKGTQLSSQVFSCSILSARQVFLQPNTLKGILHPSKKLKKIPWMILALERQPQCLVLKQRQGHILNLVIGFPFWQK